ncbi:MAG: tetratricopeptide repeat protein [Chlorobiaceae bacterium]|nr:tetratricopeptide repeat protein [Chlorobiaceae bacterium]
MESIPKHAGDRVAALYRQAMANIESGQPSQAGVLLDEIVAIRPDHFEALHFLGIIAYQQRDFRRAVDFIDRAIAFQPVDAAFHFNRGLALQGLNQLEEAITSYEKAISIKPDFPEAWSNRGNALKDLNRKDAAIASYDKAISFRQDFAHVWYNRGLALQEIGNIDAAIASYEKAISISPDFPDAWSNRGNMLKRLNQVDAAIASYDRAISIRPDYAEAWFNRGLALQGCNALDAAIASFEKAVSIRPDLFVGYLNKAMALLLGGDFKNGWALYEWRWKTNDFRLPDRNFTQELWLGDLPIAGKTILLHSEQGYGDTIQFCRYAKLVADLGARVIMEVDRVQFDLLKQLEGVAELVVKGSALPAFDLHCPLMSLPLAFHTTIETIPSSLKYLSSDPQKVAEWGLRLGPKQRPRIGLVWSGDQKHNNDYNRSVPLASLLNMLPSGFQYVSLQKEVREADRATLQSSGNIVHFGSALKDFSDTAALCDLMDLVISIDTAVVHLNAALGRLTWVLTPFSPDWRWLLDRDDSPWYPTIRLYRQETVGYWPNVFERVRADLLEFVGNLDQEFVPDPVSERGEALFQQALAFKNEGQAFEAQSLFSQVLELQPNRFEVYHHLGVMAMQSGDYQRALDFINRAIDLYPYNADFYFHRGVALQQMRQLEAAIASYDLAERLRPGYVSAWSNRGLALHDLGRSAAAIASYDRAIALQPNYADAYYNKANSLYLSDEFEAAIVNYELATAIRPDHGVAFYNRGVALQKLKQYEAAIESYEKAIAAGHNDAVVWSNRGVSFKELHQVEAAIASYEQAIAVDPGFSDAWSNRGGALHSLNMLDEAIESLDHAIAIRPDYAEANWNKSLVLLLAGEYKKGWELYEWRWKVKDCPSPVRNFAQPLWLGNQSLEGKTILLHTEQGLGDTIQFCRYVQYFSALGVRVIVEAEQSLIDLLRQLEGVAGFVVKGSALPAFDYHCPFMSFPLVFNTTVETIPSAPKYLSSNPAKVVDWAARTGPKVRPRIGLVWSGQTKHHNDYNRSIQLSALVKILPPGFEYVSLQKEVRDVDRPSFQSEVEIAHYGDQLKDFSDTAALCELMDVVISVDTSVAHLAAALGKPTWVLLPFSPDWRWLLGRDDSPWYPCVKLYRQESPGEWTRVFEKVRADLLKIAML